VACLLLPVGSPLTQSIFQLILISPTPEKTLARSGDLNVSAAKYMRVTGTSPIAGVADISDFLVFGRDAAVVNGSSTALLAGQLNFAHVSKILRQST